MYAVSYFRIIAQTCVRHPSRGIIRGCSSARVIPCQCIEPLFRRRISTCSPWNPCVLLLSSHKRTTLVKSRRRYLRVRQVITLGTPPANLADASNVTWLYELLSGSSVAVSASLASALQILPPVPTVHLQPIGRRRVVWESCKIPLRPQAENVEVNSSHLGLIWHPDVLGNRRQSVSQA